MARLIPSIEGSKEFRTSLYIERAPQELMDFLEDLSFFSARKQELGITNHWSTDEVKQEYVFRVEWWPVYD